MKNKELKKLAKKLEEIELQLRDDYGLTKISGGFVHIDMETYDDNYIYIKIKDGVQNDINMNHVFTEDKKLDRKTLEFIN
jgi:Na+-transporting NADH:ubiquinone oxidoreductase subunit NqrF